jgi:Protein of unknown function DUF72
MSWWSCPGFDQPARWPKRVPQALSLDRFAECSNRAHPLGDARPTVFRWINFPSVRRHPAESIITFYPAPNMTAEDRLRWYARFFDSVEVNATYYGLASGQGQGDRRSTVSDHGHPA